METLRAWLDRAGLAHHVGAFEREAVGHDMLAELSDDDLRTLGLPLGDRKRFRTALARDGAGTAPRTEAERRAVTLLFVDLVGSVALTSRLDPEEMREVLRLYQSTVAGVVQRFGGQVINLMGDGVLACFGWPRALGDDAERGVRAALASIEAVGALATPLGETLSARGGVATGRVVVGDLVGEHVSQSKLPVGDTPNLAARLQSAAAPGEVVIADSTRRLLGSLFRLADLGELDLKGFAGSQRAWRVLGVNEVESRFAALHGAEHGPLVGREDELSILLDRWALAERGLGQIVLMSGEAGIGKSRISLALRERLARRRIETLEFFCSPYHRTSALHPALAYLERAAGIAAADPPSARLAKLDALLGAGDGPGDDPAALVAALLSIPLGPRTPPLSLSPQARRTRVFALLLDLIERRAGERPLLILLEDAHWIDPTTAELVGLAAERLQRLRILLLITFRPEFEPPWTGRTNATSLALGRLPSSQSRSIVESLGGGAPLPRELIAEILARADGVPLFVEELTKAALEGGLPGGVSRGAGLVPETLHDSLMARLDRVPEAKRVAQVAACIGREFSLPLLVAVAGMAEPAARAALDRLVAAGLVFPRDELAADTFIFKHALVRDAAHESLLNRERQTLHARLVDVLERDYPHRARSEPELLAGHCAEAQQTDRAVAYWLRAGEAANPRCAVHEAGQHFGRALELLEQQPAGSRRAELQLRALSGLGIALAASRGFAAPEAGRAHARARELCLELGDRIRLMSALVGLYGHHLVRADFAPCRATALELREVARAQGDTGSELTAESSLGAVCYDEGRFEEARRHLERALELYDPLAHATFYAVYNHEPELRTRAWLMLTLYSLGEVEAARDCRVAALAKAADHPHLLGRAYALCFSAFLGVLEDSPDEALRHADATIEVAESHGFPFWTAQARIVRGWALAMLGEADTGLAELETAMAAWRATGARQHGPLFGGLRSAALAAAGRHDDAMAGLAEALAEVEATGERAFAAELHRLQAKLHLKADAAAALGACERALAVAVQQGAAGFERRAASLMQAVARTGGAAGVPA